MRASTTIRSSISIIPTKLSLKRKRVNLSVKEAKAIPAAQVKLTEKGKEKLSEYWFIFH